ncbi:MAG: HAD family phosphatase [Ruminococcus sp.]|nr:HAD family phosphatase [Ruminococcus sp.]
MIKGAVFDMDGLMFDSERLVYENWQKIMDEEGYDYNLDIFKKTIGLRTDEAEQYYISLYGENFDYAPLKQRSRELFFSRIATEGVPIKKGLFELLDFLKENNIKIALATSTSTDSATKMIKTAGVYDYFDALVCGDDVTNGKPHPEVFLKAAEKLGLKPVDCIAYEDSINGIKSAHSAEMTTVMVPDYLQPTDEIKPMIDCLCDDLLQSVEFVKRIILL